MLVNLRVDLHVRKRALQAEEVNGQRRAGLGFQNQLSRIVTRHQILASVRYCCRAHQLDYLIGDLSIVDCMRIALRVVDACLHHPLVIEGGEARRLVEQLVHVLIGAVRFQLQICAFFQRFQTHNYLVLISLKPSTHH